MRRQNLRKEGVKLVGLATRKSIIWENIKWMIKMGCWLWASCMLSFAFIQMQVQTLLWGDVCLLLWPGLYGAGGTPALLDTTRVGSSGARRRTPLDLQVHQDLGSLSTWIEWLILCKAVIAGSADVCFSTERRDQHIGFCSTCICIGTRKFSFCLLHYSL